MVSAITAERERAFFTLFPEAPMNPKIRGIRGKTQGVKEVATPERKRKASVQGEKEKAPPLSLLPSRGIVSSMVFAMRQMLESSPQSS